MPRSSNWLSDGTSNPVRKSLQAAAALLGLAALVMVFLLLAPPGGSRSDLLSQEAQLQHQIAGVRANSGQLKRVAAKVQLGNEQSESFFSSYILPKRTAYQQVITELQRLARLSGMTERDTVHSEEPVEGSADLTLLTTSVNYEGTYQNLRRFLTELDHSPMLIMLETLSATPQAKGNQISANMRLQTVMQEESAGDRP